MISVDVEPAHCTQIGCELPLCRRVIRSRVHHERCPFQLFVYPRGDWRDIADIDQETGFVLTHVYRAQIGGLSAEHSDLEEISLNAGARLLQQEEIPYRDRFIHEVAGRIAEPSIVDAQGIPN